MLEVPQSPVRLLAAERAAPDPAAPRYELDVVVASLRSSREITHNIRHGGRVRQPPSLEVLAEIVDDLTSALFPSHRGSADAGPAGFDTFVRGTLNRALGLLEEQVRRSLGFTRADDRSDGERERDALSIVRAFAASLPVVRGALVTDLRAAYDGDPAATSLPEILLGYPGMAAVICHRLAHVLHGLGAPLPARLISAVARSKTGVDIHPAASIGPSFFIDRGTGLVIGETAVVGARVRLYQGVTLGAWDVRPGATAVAIAGEQRHPTVEDDVTVHAGATVLGRVTIGRGSTICGNVWLTDSVPPGSRIEQASARQVGTGDR